MAVQFLPATILLALAAGLPALGTTLLPDQRGGHDSLAAHQGSPVVAVVVDARRLGTVRRWAEDLVRRFPGLHLLTVADVNEAQPTTLERVGAVLARRVPPQATVLIDMQRLWAREFALDTAAPNLLVFDAAGTPVARFRGRWSAALADEVAQRVAALDDAP